MVAGLPAMVGLLAWSEAGSKILRQFGARMLWEMAAAVAVGIGILLYATLQLVADEGANVAVLAFAALSSVLLVTIVTQRLQIESPKLRFVLNAGVAIVGIQAGVFGGLGLYLLLR